MSPEEREQLNRLCTLIQFETDQKLFSVLVKERNALLDRIEHRFADEAKKDPLP